MASGSESTSEKVRVKWEVAHQEDVVRALLEKLVDPRLPFRVSDGPPPSKDAQNSVARQMHAVVLLYNYYHRKQNPKLRFLDFVSLCKLVVVLRPSLMAFMKLTIESESTELNGAEDKFSVTEQAVKDACDIAVALDASKDVPYTEGWPISNVAVLLIDSKKENCYLQFGTVTEGVWSLIEKAYYESEIKADISAEEMVGNKRKRNNQSSSIDDSEFLQLGYDAVKDATGFDSSDLVVLETHVVYALSKLKAATHFYMLQCSQSFTIKNQVPLKYLVESLQGPLAEESFGSWIATTVVEFHHMLPYVGLISHWLMRQGLSFSSLNGCNAQSAMDHSEEEITASSTTSRILALPALKCNDKDTNPIDNNSSRLKVDFCEKKANESIDGNIKNAKHVISYGKAAIPLNLPQGIAKDVNITEKFNESCEVVESAIKPSTRAKFEIPDNCDHHYKGLQSCPSRGLSQRTATSDNVDKKNNKGDLNDSDKMEESRLKRKNLDIDDDECHKRPLSVPLTELQRMNSNDLTETCSKNEDTRENLNSKIRVYHHRPKNSPIQHDSRVLVDGVSLDTVDPLKLCGTKCRDERVSGEDGVAPDLCNQNEIAVTENQQLLIAANNAEEQKLPASEDMKNALALLYQKRQELCNQISSMEDVLAICEDNIERIRDSGEVGLARQCIKSIISGNYLSLLKREMQIQDKDRHHQPGEDHCISQLEKQTTLSDIYLPGESSCQDLEYICHKNKWRLPRYFVEPSDGKFQSKVKIKSKRFNLSSKGSLGLNPCEARESAAAHIFAKMHRQGQAAE